MKTPVLLLSLAAAAALAACSPKAQADPDKGVCFRVRNGAREVLDRPIANLQTCATRLEAVRMMEGGAVEGAFEGRSIFVTEAELTQAPSPAGTRYPVFEPAEREAVQRAIRKLLDAKGSEDGAPAR